MTHPKSEGHGEGEGEVAVLTALFSYPPSKAQQIVPWPR